MAAFSSFEDHVRSMLASSQVPASGPPSAHAPPGAVPVQASAAAPSFQNDPSVNASQAQLATATPPAPRNRRPNQAQRQGNRHKMELSSAQPQMFARGQGQYATGPAAYARLPAQSSMFGSDKLSSHGGSVQGWQEYAQHQPHTPRGPQQSMYNGNRNHAQTQAQHSCSQSNGSSQYQSQYQGSNRSTSSYASIGGYGRGQSQNRSLYDPNARSTTSSNSLPPFRQAAYLDELAKVRVPIAGMSEATLLKNQQVRMQLEVLCREALKANKETIDIPETSIRLECFGSIASGFATADSDMDVMLLHENNPERVEHHKGIPRLIEKALLDFGFGARLLTRTRVPIIRFCEKPPQDLLEKLRASRDEWDVEAARLLAEGKSAESKDVASHDSDENDEQAPEDSPTRSAAAESSSAADKVESGRKDEKKAREPKPPPYKTDEERLNLYMLAIKEDWYEPNERMLISQYSKALQQAAGNPEDPQLEEARMALDVLPDVLSRYRDPRPRKQELEYPKDGVGVLCDINFATGSHSNPLAIHNTRLLQHYSLCDDRIREMVIFVKAWAKIRKINKPYYGTLSSYGYVLMVLHFAVNVADPPIAPNLQLMHELNANTQPNAPTTCEGYDIRFWQDPTAIKIQTRNQAGNRQSLGSLLAQFFRYYAVGNYRGVNGFQWMKDVLSLRTPGGLISKESKGWTEATEQAKTSGDTQDGQVMITHRYLLAIEDPFEHAHNVGRPVTGHGIVNIRDEFRRANQMIVHPGFLNNSPEDFFAECAERERPPRYFGPNPKHKRPVRFGPQNLLGEKREQALKKAAKLAEKESAEKDTAGHTAPDAKESNNVVGKDASARPKGQRGSAKKKTASPPAVAKDAEVETATTGILKNMGELRLDDSEQANGAAKLQQRQKNARNKPKPKHKPELATQETSDINKARASDNDKVSTIDNTKSPMINAASEIGSAPSNAESSAAGTEQPAKKDKKKHFRGRKPKPKPAGGYSSNPIAS